MFQFNNAAFTPQVYAFAPVLLHPNDAHEHHIGSKLLTVMPMSNTYYQMIGRSEDQEMECLAGRDGAVIV